MKSTKTRNEPMIDRKVLRNAARAAALPAVGCIFSMLLTADTISEACDSIRRRGGTILSITAYGDSYNLCAQGGDFGELSEARESRSDS